MGLSFSDGTPFSGGVEGKPKGNLGGALKEDEFNWGVQKGQDCECLTSRCSEDRFPPTGGAMDTWSLFCRPNPQKLSALKKWLQHPHVPTI